MKRWFQIHQKLQPVLCLVAIIMLFAVFAIPMGLSNMLSTLMNTAYQLLLDTCLYIMAIAVIMGAFSEVLSEFGVVKLLNCLLSPFMNFLYKLPGAAALGIITTYLSDNPAILSLADDKGFQSFFKKYQLPALTNLGTSFGMGLIVSTYMLGQNHFFESSVFPAVFIGNVGAVIGSIVSTRMVLLSTRKAFGTDLPAVEEAFLLKPVPSKESNADTFVEGKSLGIRIIDSLMKGGKSGVQLGLNVIPGILIICTLVMMLTNQTSVYTGAAYEGIGIIPWFFKKIDFVLKPMFGFSTSTCISVPITALGSAGAAMGIVPSLLSSGSANEHDVAVFTAMCMCWSGYLSTHVSMMENLGFSELTSKSILSHTIGGLCAGIAANWIYNILF